VQKVNLAEKLRLFDETWSPRIVGELNGQYVKLAKLKGEFLWHRHEVEDELFLVVHGQLVIKFRERDMVLEAGEFLIVPRGVEHCPAAEEECHVLLFEPVATAHTGDVESERAVDQQLWI
jgi:mannose-6-phosphate isomerase-like protein (cupin superfamily)